MTICWGGGDTPRMYVCDVDGRARFFFHLSYKNPARNNRQIDMQSAMEEFERLYKYSHRRGLYFNRSDGKVLSKNEARIWQERIRS